MIRLYAIFSKKHPIAHWLILLVMVCVFLLSAYQLLENEELVYAIGLLFPALPMILFAKASEYRRKFLHD